MVRKKKFSNNRFVRFKYFFNLILALGIITVGVSLVFSATYQNRWDFDQKTVESQIQQTQALEENSKPVKIYIPKLERTLDISDGYVKNNRWKVATSGVSYLTTSGQIGKVGNAVIYGHNTAGILGELWRVQNGDFIEVTDQGGRVYKYEIFERKEIKSSEVDILNQTGDTRLTVYTCSGFLDSARFVIVGKLI